VFVDGENLSHVHAGAVVTEAERLGARGIRRVYGAAVKVAGWRQQGTFRIVDCGPGKNGADIMLALEALEAVLLEGVRHVVIASSDGDFTPLALKLAESGAQVTGIGQNKAPDGFRRACTKFVELANATPAKTPKKAPGSRGPCRRKLRRVTAAQASSISWPLATDRSSSYFLRTSAPAPGRPGRRGPCA
jgi:hypothetical protein